MWRNAKRSLWLPRTCQAWTSGLRTRWSAPMNYWWSMMISSPSMITSWDVLVRSNIAIRWPTMSPSKNDSDTSCHHCWKKSGHMWMTCYKQGLFDLVAVPGATWSSLSGGCSTAKGDQKVGLLIGIQGIWTDSITIGARQFAIIFIIIVFPYQPLLITWDAIWGRSWSLVLILLMRWAGLLSGALLLMRLYMLPDFG